MSKKRSKVSTKRSRGRCVLPIIVFILIAIALIIWGAGGANPVDPDANNPNILTISAGTQGHFDNLYIGLGNIQKNSASLHFRQDSADESMNKEVATGDELDIYGYKINVKSIKASWNPSALVGASHGSVKLLITKQ